MRWNGGCVDRDVLRRAQDRLRRMTTFYFLCRSVEIVVHHNRESGDKSPHSKKRHVTVAVKAARWRIVVEDGLENGGGGAPRRVRSARAALTFVGNDCDIGSQSSQNSENHRNYW